MQLNPTPGFCYSLKQLQNNWHWSVNPFELMIGQIQKGLNIFEYEIYLNGNPDRILECISEMTYDSFANNYVIAGYVKDISEKKRQEAEQQKHFSFYNNYRIHFGIIYVWPGDMFLDRTEQVLQQRNEGLSKLK